MTFFFPPNDTGKLGEIPGVEPKTTSSDALPLSYRRLVGAKAIKRRFMGQAMSNVLHMRDGNKCDGIFLNLVNK